jgi:molybdate transport system ATP-binding protein
VLLFTSRPDEIPASTTHLILLHGCRVVAQGPRAIVLRHKLAKAVRLAARSALRPRQENRETSTPQRPMPGRVLVELNNVTIRAKGKRLLDRVTWTIRAGERWLFVGHNGAGKTTLLSLLQGDHPQAYSEDLKLFGKSVSATHTLWQARQRIGWMSPELLLHHPPNWTVLDVVCSGFANSIGLHHRPTRHQRRLALRWMNKLGFTPLADEPLGALCLGDQRLVLLARAAVKRPRLLLLDEPCQGLDAAQRDRLLGIVDGLARDTALAVVFVTHHPDERPSCITHRLSLRAGRIVEAEPIPVRSCISLCNRRSL